MTNYRGGLLSVTLLDRCRKLRMQSTDAEHLLWQLLRGQQLGAKFRRQHQFGPYILDFYCDEHKLGVEVDGGQHFEEAGAKKDAKRTSYLQALGVRVLRCTDREVLLEPEAVLEAICQELWDPHPFVALRASSSPLPEGTGTGCGPSAERNYQPRVNGPARGPHPNPLPEGEGTRQPHPLGQGTLANLNLSGDARR